MGNFSVSSKVLLAKEIPLAPLTLVAIVVDVHALLVLPQDGLCAKGYFTLCTLLDLLLVPSKLLLIKEIPLALFTLRVPSIKY